MPTLPVNPTPAPITATNIYMTMRYCRDVLGWSPTKWDGVCELLNLVASTPDCNYRPDAHNIDQLCTWARVPNKTGALDSLHGETRDVCHAYWNDTVSDEDEDEEEASSCVEPLYFEDLK